MAAETGRGGGRGFPLNLETAVHDDGSSDIGRVRRRETCRRGWSPSLRRARARAKPAAGFPITSTGNPVAYWRPILVPTSAATAPGRRVVSDPRHPPEVFPFHTPRPEIPPRDPSSNSATTTPTTLRCHNLTIAIPRKVSVLPAPPMNEEARVRRSMPRFTEEPVGGTRTNGAEE